MALVLSGDKVLPGGYCVNGGWKVQTVSEDFEGAVDDAGRIVVCQMPGTGARVLLGVVEGEDGERRALGAVDLVARRLSRIGGQGGEALVEGDFREQCRHARLRTVRTRRALRPLAKRLPLLRDSILALPHDAYRLALHVKCPADVRQVLGARRVFILASDLGWSLAEFSEIADAALRVCTEAKQKLHERQIALARRHTQRRVHVPRPRLLVEEFVIRLLPRAAGVDGAAALERVHNGGRVAGEGGCDDGWVAVVVAEAVALVAVGAARRGAPAVAPPRLVVGKGCGRLGGATRGTHTAER